MFFVAAAIAAVCSAPLPQRWIHPLCETPAIQLPEVFDQQTIVRLGDGRLMTAHARGNGILLSADEGRTWSDPRPIRNDAVPVTPTRGPLIRTRNGVLILLFQNMIGLNERWDGKTRDWTSAFRSDLWVTRSRDDGQTWETPKLPLPGVYGTIVDAIQTRSGHVVVPVEVALTKPGRWGTYVFVSPDDGESWARSNLIDLGGNGHHDGAIEATLEELTDGRLLMLIRTSLDRFWEAYSEDHGLHWRQWGPSCIDASTAPGFLHRLASGRLVLVWNRLDPEGAAVPRRIGPSDAYGHPVSGNRTELSISYSDDDGRTWVSPTVIARQAPGSLGYPFILEASPGTLWIWTRYGSRPPVCVALREEDLVNMTGRGVGRILKRLPENVRGRTSCLRAGVIRADRSGSAARFSRECGGYTSLTGGAGMERKQSPSNRVATRRTFLKSTGALAAGFSAAAASSWGAVREDLAQKAHRKEDSNAKEKRTLEFWDSHGHLHSEFADEWVDALVERMGAQNVHKASLTGVGLLSDHEDTDVLRGYEKHPDLFFPFFCNFDPNERKSIEYVKRQLDNGPWRGVGELFLDTTDTVCANIPLRDGSRKLHPYPVPKEKSSSPVFREVFDLCGEKGLPVFVHCERLKFLCDVLPRHPKTKFLAAHCDYRCSVEEARRMLETHPNVLCDVGPVLKHMRHKNPADTASVQLHAAWRQMMQDFPDRICLGTDFYSWAAIQPEAHARVYAAFHELLAHLPLAHAQLIAGHNYRRLMGMQ